jgi:ClpX C4-type zinc finger
MATITHAQKQQFWWAAREANKSRDVVRRYLWVRFGVETSNEIPADAFTEIMQWAGEVGPCRCSFCDKPQDAVAKLISSPSTSPHRAYICDECVEVCQSILDDERATATPQPFLVQ